MLKNMLETAIGRKVSDDTFKLVADMTTEDIFYHNIKLKKVPTTRAYVIRKMLESVSAAESVLYEDIKKDSPKTA